MYINIKQIAVINLLLVNAFEKRDSFDKVSI